MIEYYFMDPEDEAYQSRFVNTGRTVESCKTLQGMIKNYLVDPQFEDLILLLKEAI